MFTPFTARGITLKNRVVVSPMAQYSCEDGMPAEYHLVHLGARAMGGAGMVVAEMTCVSPDARITPGCPGLWDAGQRDGWKRIVDYVHANSSAKIAIQLGHAGPKGSTRLAWEGIDLPLAGAAGGGDPAAAAQLAADLGVAAAVHPGRQPVVARDDPRRHGPGARRLRAQYALGGARPASTGWSCTARTATSCPPSSRR